MMPEEEREIKVNDKAFDILSRARREGETMSNVIVRLSESTLEGLQRRGEQEVETQDGRKVVITIEQDKCLGAMSCVTMAPTVFKYDDTSKGTWRKAKEPLGMHKVEGGSFDLEALMLTAESCPYQAIHLKEANTGEQLFP